MQKSVHTAEYRALRAELVQARKKAGFTQRDVAALLDVAPSWVAKVEAGERRIDLIELCWFLAACAAEPAPVLRRIVAAAKASKGGRRK